MAHSWRAIADDTVDDVVKTQILAVPTAGQTINIMRGDAQSVRAENSTVVLSCAVNHGSH
jgi:hypothetical protein